MRGPIPTPVRLATPFAALLLLAACDRGNPPQDGSSEAVSDVEAGHPSEPSEDIVKKSIIRAEVDTGPTEAPRIEPTDLVVPFPAKGSKPEAEGLTVVDRVLEAPAYLAGGPVTISGHSDSRGNDAENLAASRRRAEAVRDYLAEKGVAEERMTVVALGEANPIAPNRKPDGTDDMEGRAKNRRVEIRVDLPAPPAEPETKAE